MRILKNWNHRYSCVCGGGDGDRRNDASTEGLCPIGKDLEATYGGLHLLPEAAQHHGSQKSHRSRSMIYKFAGAQSNRTGEISALVQMQLPTQVVGRKQWPERRRICVFDRSWADCSLCPVWGQSPLGHPLLGPLLFSGLCMQGQAAINQHGWPDQCLL